MKECILDYLGGYVAKKFAKLSCKDRLQTLTSNSREPPALTQIKTRGLLQAPLRLLQIVEEHVEMCTMDKRAYVRVYNKIKVSYVEKGSDPAWRKVLYEAGLATGEQRAQDTTTATDHHRLLQ